MGEADLGDEGEVVEVGHRVKGAACVEAEEEAIVAVRHRGMQAVGVGDVVAKPADAGGRAAIELAGRVIPAMEPAEPGAVAHVDRDRLFGPRGIDGLDTVLNPVPSARENVDSSRIEPVFRRQSRANRRRANEDPSTTFDPTSRNRPRPPPSETKW